MIGHLRAGLTALITTDAEIKVCGFYELTDLIKERVRLIHRGSLFKADIPHESINLLPISGGTWWPVRFEFDEKPDDYRQIRVVAVHDGGGCDGKPFYFPGQKTIAFNVDVKED